ncbi:MAG: DUF932 domain-containing protein [Planctomycetota bacterium]
MHEITDTDNLVLHERGAWHGLGTVVEDAPTPREALELAGLGWTVQQLDLVAGSEDEGLDEPLPVPSHVANVRSDTGGVLGVVGRGYEPIQNAELAAFSEALAEQGDEVKIESAGSIRSGKRVWFLLKGESLSIDGDGEHVPYICVSNGHDGTAAMRCTPTTVRVVCSNTLHMVIPDGRDSGRITKGFVVRHTGDVRGKVEAAKRALELYGRSRDATAELLGTLAAKDVSRSAIQDFWLDVYQRIQAPVPTNPSTPGEKAQRTAAERAMKSMAARFDLERDALGARPSALLALNAFTGWMQHDRPVTGKTLAARAENRVRNRLFGETVGRTGKALEAAVAAFG